MRYDTKHTETPWNITVKNVWPKVKELFAFNCKYIENSEKKRTN